MLVNVVMQKSTVGDVLVQTFSVALLPYHPSNPLLHQPVGDFKLLFVKAIWLLSLSLIRVSSHSFLCDVLCLGLCGLFRPKVLNFIIQYSNMTFHMP